MLNLPNALVSVTALALTSLVAFACGKNGGDNRDRPIEDMVRVPTGRYHVVKLHYRNDNVCTPELAGPVDGLVVDAWKKDDVDVASFQIDKRWVSVCDYKTCVQQSACPDIDVKCYPDSESQIVYDYPYKDAWAYCAWRGLRLPTYVEWQVAVFGQEGPRRHPECERHLPCVVTSPFGVEIQLQSTETTRSLECSRWTSGGISPQIAIVQGDANWRSSSGLGYPIPEVPEFAMGGFRCVRDPETSN